MSFPKVTVGMPAFNRAHVLGDTIQQVLDQTFHDFEFIIYNDGSADNTSEIVNSFKDPRIIFLDKKNLGPPYPLNAILEIATGEFIIILHDHDFFHPQLLEKSVAALEKYPAAGFVLQGSSWIDEDGVSGYTEMLEDIPEFNQGRSFGEKILLDEKKFSSIFHACSMVRNSAYEAVGKMYDPAFGLYADVDLWLRLLNKFDFIYLKEVLFKFRTREVSGHFLSGRDFDVVNWVYLIHQKNLQLYFGESYLYSQYHLLIESKKAKQDLQLTLKSAGQKNKESFLKGLRLVEKSKHQSHLSRIVAGIVVKCRLSRPVIFFAYHLNNFRKKRFVS